MRFSQPWFLWIYKKPSGKKNYAYLKQYVQVWFLFIFKEQLVLILIYCVICYYAVFSNVFCKFWRTSLVNEIDLYTWRIVIVFKWFARMTLKRLVIHTNRFLFVSRRLHSVSPCFKYRHFVQNDPLPSNS